MFQPAKDPAQHTRFEDAQALITAALFVALGIGVYSHAGLLTSGTAGIAFSCIRHRLRPGVLRHQPAVRQVRAHNGWTFAIRPGGGGLLSVFSEARRWC
jgi:hypothetical protein